MHNLAAHICLLVCLVGNPICQSSPQQEAIKEDKTEHANKVKLVYGYESPLTPVPPEMNFGNVRYLHSIPTVFRKPDSQYPGLSEHAWIGRCYTYAIALDNSGLKYKGSTQFKTILVNLDGKMDFKDSPRVVQLKPGMDIKQIVIQGKKISLGVYASGYYEENETCYFSVVPVFQAPLNIGGKDVLVLGASLDGDMDYSPEKDKLVIHEPTDPANGFRSIIVYDIEIGRAFKFGEGQKRSWYELEWNGKKKTIRVKESKQAMGFLSAPVDWSITLKPGDTTLKGAANEKVAAPVGDYTVYLMSFKHDDARLAEFDYHLSKKDGPKTAPKIVIKKNETLMLEPLREIHPWFVHGWHQNELTVVMGFANSRHAGNMAVLHKEKEVKWEYEIVRADNGNLITSGEMTYG